MTPKKKNNKIIRLPNFDRCLSVTDRFNLKYSSSAGKKQD